MAIRSKWKRKKLQTQNLENISPLHIILHNWENAHLQMAKINYISLYFNIRLIFFDFYTFFMCSLLLNVRSGC